MDRELLVPFIELLVAIAVIALHKRLASLTQSSYKALRIRLIFPPAKYLSLMWIVIGAFVLVLSLLDFSRMTMR